MVSEDDGWDRHCNPLRVMARWCMLSEKGTAGGQGSGIVISYASLLEKLFCFLCLAVTVSRAILQVNVGKLAAVGTFEPFMP